MLQRLEVLRLVDHLTSNNNNNNNNNNNSNLSSKSSNLLSMERQVSLVTTTLRMNQSLTLMKRASLPVMMMRTNLKHPPGVCLRSASLPQPQRQPQHKARLQTGWISILGNGPRLRVPQPLLFLLCLLSKL